MHRRVSIRRLVGALVAAGLVTVAVHCGLECDRGKRDFQEWIVARPASTAVDLSRPGRLTAPFNQTCQTAHGEAFLLALPASLDKQAADELLAGLEGTIAITEADGTEVVVRRINERIDPETGLLRPIMLAYFHPFSKGDYTVTINVARGAPALAGTPQTLYAQYELCGLEQFPALIAGCLAFVFGIPATIVSAAVLIGFVRHGIWTASDGSVPAGDHK